MSAASKRTVVVWFERYLQNPPIKAALLAGLPLPMFALVETTGRRSGKRRRTPVINGLDGRQFWIIAEHGHHAGYVRNIEANPAVRVKTRGVWRTGTACILSDDDPYARAKWMSDTLGPLHKADAGAVRLLGTTPLTIRVDLD